LNDHDKSVIACFEFKECKTCHNHIINIVMETFYVYEFE